MHNDLCVLSFVTFGCAQWLERLLVLATSIKADVAYRCDGTQAVRALRSTLPIDCVSMLSCVLILCAFSLWRNARDYCIIQHLLYCLCTTMCTLSILVSFDTMHLNTDGINIVHALVFVLIISVVSYGRGGICTRRHCVVDLGDCILLKPTGAVAYWHCVRRIWAFVLCSCILLNQQEQWRIDICIRRIFALMLSCLCACGSDQMLVKRFGRNMLRYLTLCSIILWLCCSLCIPSFLVQAVFAHYIRKTAFSFFGGSFAKTRASHTRASQCLLLHNNIRPLRGSLKTFHETGKPGKLISLGNKIFPTK